MSIPSWARKGQRVVCISENPVWAHLPVVTPRVGVEYTLRKVYVAYDGEAVCILSEIPDQFCTVPGSTGIVNFGLYRFAPLVTDSDDNEIETVLYRQRKDKLHQRVPAKSRERA